MAQTDPGDTSSRPETPGAEIIRAKLAIEPHPESSCAIVERSGEQEVRSQNLKTPMSCLENVADRAECEPSTCSECHTVVSTDCGGCEYLKTSVHEKCICPVFEEHDCIPEINAVRSRTIIVTLSIRERTMFTELIEDLRAVGADISVEWIVDGSPGNETAEIDVSAITAKQREAMKTAIQLGYYETPRSANLEEIAAELSISESAVSQRLNNAETKLVTEFLDK